MLSLEMQIERTQRLLDMIEQDAPLLAVRVSELNQEYQRSAKEHAAQLAARARAELQRLQKEQAGESLQAAG
jgi:hypothetical protein